LLSDWLDLDFFMLVSARPEQLEESAAAIDLSTRRLPAEAPDPLKQPTLKRVLDGESMVHGESMETHRSR